MGCGFCKSDFEPPNSDFEPPNSDFTLGSDFTPSVNKLK